jgi:diguanylate cyclase (GGDEF)-like protein/PAS domain S-box-containing protein
VTVPRGEERFEALALHSTDIAVVYGLDGTLAYVTPSLAALLGYRADELVGTTGVDFIHPDDLAAAMPDLEQAMAVGETITREWRLCLADGTWGWYEFTLTDLSEDPGIRGIVAHFRDVNDRHATGTTLLERDKRFERTVELTRDGFLAIGPDGRITGWNPAATEMFGWSHDEALGRDVAELIVPEPERQLYLSRFDRAVAEDMPHLLEAPFEMVAVDRTGRQFPVEVQVVQVNLGAQHQFQAFVRDIGARKALEARLADHGFTDSLTKLPNRALLGDRLSLAVSRLARRSTSVAVLLLELDDAQQVRDNLGDEVGDQLVVRVANRLAAAVRASDTVARYARDTFVVVAEDLKEPAQAVSIAHRALETLTAPMSHAGTDIEPSLSIGIALTSSSELSPEDLLRQADAAMTQARREGGGRFVVYGAASRAS